MSTERPPLHDSLHVVAHEDIYRNDDWWKSVVRYRFEPDGDAEEAAVYLWHNDEGWTRKNKYVIKTRAAWETDREIVSRLFSRTDESSTAEFPTSDYYTVDAGETVFQSDGWWKAILRITEKGSYETEEVMIYLWQQVDGDWRRRQKYTLKSESRWEDEAAVVGETVEAMSDESIESTSQSGSDGPSHGGVSDEIERVESDIELHLSDVVEQ